MANGTPANGNGRLQFVPWIMGILSVLITAGVIASIGTFGRVVRMDENIELFRNEVFRELNRHERAIELLDEQIDRHRETEPPGGQ